MLQFLAEACSLGNMNKELATAIGMAGNQRKLATQAGLPVRTVYYQVKRGYLGHKEAYAVAEKMGFDSQKLMERSDYNPTDTG